VLVVDEGWPNHKHTKIDDIGSTTNLTKNEQANRRTDEQTNRRTDELTN
jgi:hypothetical protein